MGQEGDREDNGMLPPNHGGQGGVLVAAAAPNSTACNMAKRARKAEPAPAGGSKEGACRACC